MRHFRYVAFSNLSKRIEFPTFPRYQCLIYHQTLITLCFRTVAEKCIDTLKKQKHFYVTSATRAGST